MDVQTVPMAGALKITLHPSVHQAGLIPGFLEPFADPAMDFHAVCTVPDLGTGFLLRTVHDLAELLQLWTGCATHDRPRHVGTITRGRRPWKHVEDDAAVCW